LSDPSMLVRCLEGLRRVEGIELEIVVVLNNLGAMPIPAALEFLAPWNVTALHVGGDFNWSTLSNAAAAQAATDLLLFLNDDVEPLESRWLSAMIAILDEPDVGAVGAVLRYPSGRIQHAGVTIRGGEAPECRHAFRDCTGAERRIARWLDRDRTQSAVTGACMLTRRTDFERIGGFDERLAVIFNDVDYCLRLREAGLRSVVAADAQLIHHEGISRFGILAQHDHDVFAARWAASLPVDDPFSHPKLTKSRDDWMFDPDAGVTFEPRIFDVH
jgi:cellulose synthase/poly-beta-1,6-N-acetylglucosamine synthase-like glycosyltransferase